MLFTLFFSLFAHSLALLHFFFKDNGIVQDTTQQHFLSLAFFYYAFGHMLDQ